MDEEMNVLGSLFEALNQNNSGKNKYDGKAIRFLDKNSHYELIFTDDFNITGRFNAITTDLLLDLKDANKEKELHIFINSMGGALTTLTSLIQLIREFEYVVTIAMGEADSAGFMLWSLGNERYCSPYTTLMYHSATSGMEGKLSELANYSEHAVDNMQHILRALQIDNILTKEELEKGETTEIWISGEELIKRGKAFDYSQYKNREFAKGELVIDLDNMLLRKNPLTKRFDVYMKDENARDFSYREIREQILNKDSIAYKDILKPEVINKIKKANGKRKRNIKK